MALPSKNPRRRQETTKTAGTIHPDDQAIAVSLQVQGGLLMAFGPDGDPMPPRYLKEAFSGRRTAKLRMSTGALVDSDRVLAVLDAQQRGALAKRTSKAWIESMLGLAGSFEETPEDLLQREPDGEMPPHPPSVYLS